MSARRSLLLGALWVQCASALPASSSESTVAPPQFQPPPQRRGINSPYLTGEPPETPEHEEVPETPDSKEEDDVIQQIDDSTFCFMVYKVGVEDELVEYMWKHRMGVFSCDDYTVFSLFDTSDPKQPECKYGGDQEDGCNVANPGPTTKPLLFEMSELPRLNEKAVVVPWTRHKSESTQEEATRLETCAPPCTPRSSSQACLYQ